MSLRQLRIANFKAIRGPVDLDFSRLTFLYGPNSAGKSAVLDALDLLVSIGTGTFIDVDGLLNFRHTNSSSNGIRLGATVFIDGQILATIGTSKFAELEALYGVLTQGASIDLDIQFEAEYWPNGIKELDISINNEPVVAYRYQRDNYGPYFATGAEKVGNSDAFEAILSLVGEWRINGVHDVSADICINPNRGCARAKRAFDQIADDVRVVRGLTCNANPARNRWVALDQESLDLVFPQNVRDITAEAHAPSSLYRDQTVIFPETEHPNVYCHANYLKQFVLDDSEADVDRYLAFLQQEFSPENSAKLFSELRQQAGKLNVFVEALLFTVAQAIRLPRVPGSRANIDSRVPIHLKSQYQGEYDRAPRETRSVISGAKLYEGERVCGEFQGARKLKSALGVEDPRVSRLVAPYAEACARAAWAGARLDDREDFPNYCLKRYLHSLSKYRIAPDTYFLRSRDYTGNEDETWIADSSLVYFSLRDPTGSRRAFSEVGSGVGYVFPILAALGHFDQIAIEQPELHLHPGAQDQLADVFIHAANTTGQYSPRRLIIESHSEVFLLRIAKRIRENHELEQSVASNVTAVGETLRLRCDGVRIHYFNPRPDMGTEIVPIRFAPDGSLIDDWPEGMFSTDWTSGLDRMTFFSERFNAMEAERAQSWIASIGDSAVRKWLATAWLLEKLGDAATESAVILWGKIVEKVMADSLLEPLKGMEADAWYRDERLGPGLHDFFQKEQRPGLGWWRESVIALKREFGIQPKFTRCLREYIREQSWSQQWNEILGGDLIRSMDSLVKARNAAAHSGHTEMEDVRQGRQLVMADNQPGLIFHALGLFKRDRPRLRSE